MSAKHTPGPWRTEYRDGHEMIFGPRGYIAGVESSEDEHTPEKEIIANARLIAAAPDLLGAVKSAFERLTDNDMVALGSYDLAKQLQAAIAKAEGLGK